MKTKTTGRRFMVAVMCVAAVFAMALGSVTAEPMVVRAANGIDITKDTVVLKPEGTITLAKTIADGITDAEWSSNDESVASVTQEGVVTAGSSTGTATITLQSASDSTKTDSCTVYVATIKIPDAQKDIKVESTYTLSPVITPTAVDVKYEVTASNPSNCISVDGTGKITATKVGTATIKVCAKENDNIYDTCTVKVYKSINTVAINATDTEYPNSAYTIKATANPADAEITSYEWSTAATDVIEIPDSEKNKAEPRVTVKKAGTATIQLTVKDANGTSTSASNNITVSSKLESVSITASATAIEINKTATFNATIEPSGAKYSAIEWYSGTPAVAKTTDTAAIATFTAGSDAGSTIIHAKVTRLDGTTVFSNQIILDVHTSITEVASISIQGATTLTKGADTTLTAVVLPSDATEKTVYWESSNTTTATVTQDGKVKAIKSGTVTITARAKDGSNKSETHSITIKDTVKKITGITLAGEKTVWTGTPETLTATIAPSDADEQKLDWSSSDPAVATVSGTGLTANVDGKKAGTVTITAAAKDGSGVKAFYEMTVKEKVTGLSFSPSSLTIGIGETLTLTPSITPSTAKPVITWKSDNTSKVSVSNGVIKGIAAGGADITATIAKETNQNAEVTGTVTVTVSAEKPYITTGEVLKSGTPNKDYTETLKAQCKDEETLTWSIVGLNSKPDGSTLTKESFSVDKGVLKFKPDKKGEYKVTVKVTSNGLSGEKTFTINVQDVSAEVEDSKLSNDSALVSADGVNLDKYAESMKKKYGDKSVEVILQVAAAKAADATKDQKNLASEAKAILLGVSSDKMGIHYLDVKLITKIDGAEVDQGDAVIGFYIKVNFSKQKDPLLLLHKSSDGKIEFFKNAKTKEDKTFYKDGDYLYIYSSDFSPFVIAYPTVDTYSVTFHSDEGEVPETIYVEEDGKISKMPLATKSGDTFVGWYYDKELTKPWSASDKFTKDTNLYAKWTSSASSNKDDDSSTGNTKNTNAANAAAGGRGVSSPQTGDRMAVLWGVIALIVLLNGAYIVLAARGAKRD